MGYGDLPYPFSPFWAICNERREQIDRAYITIVQPVYIHVCIPMKIFPLVQFPNWRYYAMLLLEI